MPKLALFRHSFNYFPLDFSATFDFHRLKYGMDTCEWKIHGEVWWILYHDSKTPIKEINKNIVHLNRANVVPEIFYSNGLSISLVSVRFDDFFMSGLMPRSKFMQTIVENTAIYVSQAMYPTYKNIVWRWKYTSIGKRPQFIDLRQWFFIDYDATNQLHFSQIAAIIVSPMQFQRWKFGCRTDKKAATFEIFGNSVQPTG